MRSGSQVLVTDYDLACSGGQEFAFDDLLDLIGRKYREHDRIALPRYVGECCSAPADLRKTLVPCRNNVKSDDAKSRGDQAAGIALSHQSDADQSDGCLGRHLICSLLMQQHNTFVFVLKAQPFAAIPAARFLVRAPRHRDSRAAPWASECHARAGPGVCRGSVRPAARSVRRAGAAANDGCRE